MDMILLLFSFLLLLVGIIFLILNIRLFFKIWDMTDDVAIIRKMMEVDRRKRAKAEAAEKAEEASEHKDDVGVEVKKGYKSVVQSDDDGISGVVKMFIIILILLSIVFLLIISD